MNPERMIADLEARARELGERSRELRDRLRGAQATQRSPDGAVTATVAPNGSLRHIEFSPDATRFSPARLGEVVLDTVRRAQARAARQAADSVGPRFGGTAAMDFLTGHVPPAAAADGPAGMAADLAVDGPADLAVDRPADVAVDGPADLAVDRPADVAVDGPADLAADVAVDRPADVQVDMPVVVAVDVPADGPTDVAVNGPAEAAELPLPRSLRAPDDEPGTARR